MSVWAKYVGAGLWNESLQRDKKTTALLYAGRFFLGVMLGGARLFDGCGPFGVAAVAAAGTETAGLIYLGGASIGYLLSGGITAGTRYIATALLVFTVGFVTRSTALHDRRWFMPAAAFFMVTLVNVLNLSGGFYTAETLVRTLTEIVLAGGCTCFFGLVIHPETARTEAAEVRHSISVAVMFTCAAMGAAEAKLFGSVSIGRICALLGVMAGAFCGGGAVGCTAGIAMGFGMDMAEGTGLFCTACYSLAGMTAGFFYRYGRPAFCSVFCAVAAMAALLSWENSGHVCALYESISAGAIFMLLPQRVLAPVGDILRVGRGMGETAFRLHQAGRLERLSEGFRMLYACAGADEGAGTDECAMNAVFDRAADAVCRKCSELERCWYREGDRTVGMLDGLADRLAAGGVLRPEDMPDSFRASCLAPDSFVGAVNGELRGLSYRRRYEARLRELRASAYGQFSDMADIMSMAAGEMRGNAGPDAAAERRVIRFLKSRDAEGVCSAFRDVRGRLHVMLDSGSLDELDRRGDLLECISAALGVAMCRETAQPKGRLMLRQAEPLAASVGIASVKKEGEDVSGDWGTYFKTSEGLLCIVLSDGMGTGKHAAKESAASVEILRQLLQAGVEPGGAMRLLNAAALLKNGEDWGYATVDLCCIDLFTGETCFYKYGAAPSYVKTAHSIRRVKCTSLAAGMLGGEGSAPDVTRMFLKPGSVALIASDGVVAERKDQWLRDILGRSEGAEPKEIARKALQAANDRFGALDDMTALAVRLERRQQ